MPDDKLTSLQAAKLGLKAITERDKPDATVAVVDGRITYQSWCEREYRRLFDAGRHPRIVHDPDGFVSVWALPPAAVPEVVREP